MHRVKKNLDKVDFSACNKINTFVLAQLLYFLYSSSCRRSLKTLYLSSSVVNVLLLIFYTSSFVFLKSEKIVKPSLKILVKLVNGMRFVQQLLYGFA